MIFLGGEACFQLAVSLYRLKFIIIEITIFI